jgi:hypothetical protein
MPVSARVIERTRMSASSRQQVKRFNGWGKTEHYLRPPVVYPIRFWPIRKSRQQSSRAECLENDLNPTSENQKRYLRLYSGERRSL